MVYAVGAGMVLELCIRTVGLDILAFCHGVMCSVTGFVIGQKREFINNIIDVTRVILS